MLFRSAAAAAATLGAPAAPAAAARVDLGPPSYDAYCKSIGLAAARFTAPPDRQWGCLQADGSVAPMNVQAACEFTYAKRPTLAEQVLPGALYSWQCIETAAPAGGSPGSGGGAPGATGKPGNAQLYAALHSALAPTGRAARIGALLRRGGYLAGVKVLEPATIAISWYSVPRGARIALARPHATLLATGHATFAAAGTGSITIRLTARGRLLLRRARRITLTARGTFTVAGLPAVVALRTFTLSR